MMGTTDSSDLPDPLSSGECWVPNPHVDDGESENKLQELLRPNWDAPWTDKSNKRWHAQFVQTFYKIVKRLVNNISDDALKLSPKDIKKLGGEHYKSQKARYKLQKKNPEETKVISREDRRRERKHAVSDIDDVFSYPLN